MEIDFELRDSITLIVNIRTNGQKLTNKMIDEFDIDEKTCTAVVPFPCLQWLQSLIATINARPLPKKFLDLVELVSKEMILRQKSRIFTQSNVEHVYAVLKQHQIDTIDDILKRPNYITSLDMGLGKTLITLTVCIYLLLSRVLIVSPSTLIPNWISEMKKWLNPDIIQIVHLKTTKASPELLTTPIQAGKVNFFIISYNLLKPLTKELCKYKWDLICYDEAHYLQSRVSQRSKVAYRLHKHTKREILLSGSLGDRSEEMFSPLHLIQPDIFAKFYTYHSPKSNKPPAPSTTHFYFAERYCIVDVIYLKGGRKTWNFKRSQRLKELHAMISPFLIRKKLKDVLDLPPCVKEEITICYATPTQIKKFNSEMEKINELRNTSQHEADRLLMDLTFDTAKLKLKHVITYILNTCETYKGKIVIWFYHNDIGAEIVQKLEESQLKCILVDQSVPSGEPRETLLKTWELSPDIQLAVLSLGTCSTGYNFTFCHLSICAELGWKAKTLIQSEYRCYRIGQTEKVVVQYLLMDGTTDSMLMNSYKRKLLNSGEICSNERTSLGFKRKEVDLNQTSLNKYTKIN